MHSWKHHIMSDFTVPAAAAAELYSNNSVSTSKHNQLPFSLLFQAKGFVSSVTHLSVWTGESPVAECESGLQFERRSESASWFCCCHLRERQQGCGFLLILKTGQGKGGGEKRFFFSLGDKQQFRQMEMTRLSIKIHIYQFYSNDNS